jgi:sugar O-acyltransferase (sialic acid O-acetyltransferase NeuD family)
MKKIALIGSSALAEQLLALLKNVSGLLPVGYFDDFRKCGELINELPVLGASKDVLDHYDRGVFDALIVAVGYEQMDFKANVFQKFQNKIPFHTHIDPACSVDPTSKIGEGCILFPGCVVNSGVVLGENVFMYSNCTISHDSIVGDHSFFGPGVTLSGYCHIGKACFLGVGTIISDHIHVVDETTTGAGTVVIRNLTKSGTYIGVPAKQLK